MLQRHEPSPESVRAAMSTAILQNRAFIELARVFVSGDAAILSSALPIIVRGAMMPSGAILDLSNQKGLLLAAHQVPTKLRAYLEEPLFSSERDFLAQRALAHRHALVDGDVFGRAATNGALEALEEAAWESTIAVPFRTQAMKKMVLLVGVRRAAASANTVAFLEAAANFLSACLPLSFAEPCQ